MSANENLVRTLQAATFQPSPDSEIWFIHVEDGNITEKTFEGSEWSLPRLIASGVAAQTPAAYFQGANTRFVFTIENSTIKNYVYNSDDDEWEAGKIQGSNIITHAESKITVLPTEVGTPRVFFQDKDGKIQSVTSGDGINWKTEKIVSEHVAIPGTVLSSSAVDTTAYLFFQSEDGSIHYLTQINSPASFDKGATFTPAPFRDAKLLNGEVGADTTVSQLVATGHEDVYYLTDTGKVCQVTPEQKVDIGTVDGQGQFKASTSAECFFFKPLYRPPVSSWSQTTIKDSYNTTTINNYYGSMGKPW